MSTLRDRLKAAAKFSSEVVEVAGLKIEIRELSSGKRLEFGSRAARSEKSNDPDAIAKLHKMLVSQTAFDPDTGERVWPDGALNEMDELPGLVVEKLGHLALRVNALGEGASAEAKKD
jgi:hypothetical protein